MQQMDLIVDKDVHRSKSELKPKVFDPKSVALRLTVVRILLVLLQSDPQRIERVCELSLHSINMSRMWSSIHFWSQCCCGRAGVG